MLGEIASLTAENELLVWAKDALSRKNALLETDARSIETAYQERLGGMAHKHKTGRPRLPDRRILCANEARRTCRSSEDSLA
jgi:hypothetical protein